MPNATDAQMQAFADQRIRPFAESVRLLLSQAQDSKAAIGDEYSRAISNSAWADARTDGPPHLLQSGNSANPDDLLNFNAWISAFVNLVTGTSVANGSTVAADGATLASAWGVLQRACVRPAS